MGKNAMTTTTSTNTMARRTTVKGSECAPETFVITAAMPQPTANPNDETNRRMGACLNSGVLRVSVLLRTTNA